MATIYRPANEIQRVELMKKFWYEGYKGQMEWTQQANKNYGYFYGGERQWNPKDIAILDNLKRVHLSINIIFPIINLLTGYERQNRLDIKCYPKKGGNYIVADLMTELCKHIEDTSDALYERSMMFFDGIISSKGFVSLGIRYEDDPFNGEIISQNETPFDICEDPNNKRYDLNNGKYVIKSYWGDKEQIKLLYPKHAKDIDSVRYDDLDTRDRQWVPGMDRASHEFKGRIRETWWKHYEKATFLIDTYNLNHWKVHKGKIDLLKVLLEKDRQIAEEEGREPTFTVREQVVPVLNCTTTYGDIELEHREAPYGEMTRFPIMRFVPYFVNGEFLGAVDNLIDVQNEKNKRRSQTLNLLNQSVNSGFFNHKTLGADTPTLEEQSRYPAPVIEYNSVMPVKIEPTPASTAHIQMEQLAEQDATKISSVNMNMLARGAASESGVKDRQRINQGLIGSEIVFDNSRQTFKTYSETMIDLIRYTDTFSTQEIVALASDARIETNVDELLMAIKSKAIGKYGVKVEASPTNPTIRFSNFEMLLDMARIYGELIPPDMVIDASDLPQKEEIIDRMRQQAQQQAMLNQQEQLRLAQGQTQSQQQPQQDIEQAGQRRELAYR